jgi:cathepsin F
MRSLIALCLLSFVLYANCLHADNRLYAQQQFLAYVTKYNKNYASALEYSLRFKNFWDNLKRIEEHNASKDSFTMEINEFADLSVQEFSKIYLQRPISADSLRRMYGNVKVDNTTRTKGKVPTSFDWREKGAVTHVKNQGGCGSCWTYSTTGNIEGVNFVKTQKLVALSQQQLVDCDKECGTDPIDGTKYCDGGCQGGWMMTAFQYIIKAGGISTEEAYPGGSHQGAKCLFKNETIGVKLSSWKMLSTNEDELVQQLIDNGPIAVAFNAAKIMFYSRGIVTGSNCDPKQMTHAVLLVGFGEENGKKFYIVKNSWSASWGEKGYFRIERGTNACGIATVPCTAVVA